MNVFLWIVGIVTNEIIGVFVITAAIRHQNSRGDSMIEDPILIGGLASFWIGIPFIYLVSGFFWFFGSLPRMFKR